MWSILVNFERKDHKSWARGSLSARTHVCRLKKPRDRKLLKKKGISYERLARPTGTVPSYENFLRGGTNFILASQHARFTVLKPYDLFFKKTYILQMERPLSCRSNCF